MLACLPQDDATGAMKAQEENDADFFMFKAKLSMCTREDPHAHADCPFLHPGECGTRRDPSLIKYMSTPCFDLHDKGICPRGLHCPFSHNQFEYFLHPHRFRTTMCRAGPACTRTLCFFAHNASELRQRPARAIAGPRRRASKKHQRGACASLIADEQQALNGFPAGSCCPGVQPYHMPQAPLPFTPAPPGISAAAPSMAMGAASTSFAATGHHVVLMPAAPLQPATTMPCLQPQAAVYAAAPAPAPISSAAPCVWVPNASDFQQQQPPQLIMQQQQPVMQLQQPIIMQHQQPMTQQQQPVMQLVGQLMPAYGAASGAMAVAGSGHSYAIVIS